jgi:hypothetical protein
LTIQKAALHHSGTYVCLGSNRAGTLDAKVKLEVLALPKIINTMPEPVLVGKPATINCEIENDDSTTSVKWLFVRRDNFKSLCF